MKLQNLYNTFKAAAKKYDELDQAFENDFENEELEQELDSYYEDTYYPAFTNLLNELMKLTGCDRATAHKMIESKEFENMMNCKIIG